MTAEPRNDVPSSDYLLGVNERELERLRFQHSVWGPVTERFFDRLKVGPGWKCLDVGGGPGLVALDLCKRVGREGEVTVLEPSGYYLDQFMAEASRRGWRNARAMQGTAEKAQLPPGRFDLVFARWVMSFAPDPEEFLVPLLSSLRPGGVMAVQDYYYEGLSLYPGGGAFDRMADVVRAHYRAGGGDPYVTGKIPALLRRHGARVIEFSPNCLAGGPESGIMQWADRFFTVHTQAMVDRGIVSQTEGDAMLADWIGHRENPDALFFSPIVVDVAGVREA